MKEAACSWRTMTGLIFRECLSATMQPAAFSPAPPNAASTPTLSNALTIASYTRIDLVSDANRGINRAKGRFFSRLLKLRIDENYSTVDRTAGGSGASKRYRTRAALPGGLSSTPQPRQYHIDRGKALVACIAPNAASIGSRWFSA
jgi:hypothetical protein